MPVSDQQLDQIVRALRSRQMGLPAQIKPGALVRDRNLLLYRGQGIVTPYDLAHALVHDRLVASHEMDSGLVSRVNYICRLASISFAGSPPRPGRVAGQRWCGSWGRQTRG